MDTRKIITIVLMIFVVGSAAFMIYGGLTGENAVDSEGDSSAVGTEAGEVLEPGSAVGGNTDAGFSGDTGERVENAHHVVAYYFYTTKRCPTCLKIEKYTKESLETNFPNLLESGNLEFRALNLEEGENEKYIEEYQLTTKSVILVDYRDGERVGWKNLEKVWEYTGNREVFVDYVKDETLAYLAELSGVE